MLRFRVLVLAVTTALLMAGAPGTGSPSREALPEYPVKAAFLYHFLEFVEWPESARLPGPVTIGVLGRDPFGDVLDDAVLHKMTGGRPIVVRRFATVAALAPCDILFISTSEMAHLPAILARFQGSPVLTVGEADRFAQRGGMIGFFLEDHRVRLEVNRQAAETAGLRVSSKLLGVARLVKTDAAGTSR